MITSISIVLGLFIYLAIGFGVETEYVKRSKVDPQDASYIMFAWLFLLFAFLVEMVIRAVRKLLKLS